MTAFRAVFAMVDVDSPAEAHTRRGVSPGLPAGGGRRWPNLSYRSIRVLPLIPNPGLSGQERLGSYSGLTLGPLIQVR